MKYIDAEKLLAEIERRRLSNRYIDTEGYENELLEIITSLQQEQPETDLLEESYMRGFAQGAKEERERMREDIAKLSDTAEKRGLNFGAECGFQIALDELEQG